MAAHPALAGHPAFSSPSEYLVLEADSSVKHEFLDGVIYAMSGASGNHIAITGNLAGLLWVALRGGPCQHLGQDMKVWVAESRAYFYPDATVACPPHFINRSSGIIDNPKVVFEVLSPSTELFDKGAKFAYYTKLASLQSYILIDSQAIHIKVFNLEEGKWMVREYNEEAAEIPIPSLDLNLDTSEIYRHVKFEE